MRTQVRNFLIKPLLAIAIAIPAMMAGNVTEADASSRHKRGAIIAGAIIGGAILYKHHKRKKYKRAHRKHYGHGYYKPVRKHHRVHRHHRLNRHHKVRRHHHRSHYRKGVVIRDRFGNYRRIN